MTLDELSNPLVRDAMHALIQRDRDEWFGNFHPDARVSDDNGEHEYVLWSDDQIFGETGTIEVSAIVRESPDGETVYTRIVSSNWGEMDAAWRFTIENGEITRLTFGET